MLQKRRSYSIQQPAFVIKRSSSQFSLASTKDFSRSMSFAVLNVKKQQNLRHRAAVKIQRAYRAYLRKRTQNPIKAFLLKVLQRPNIRQQLYRDNSQSSLISNQKSLINYKKIDKLFELAKKDRVRLISASGYRFTKKDFNHQDSKGYSPLHYAVNGSYALCQKMLHLGADPNLKAKDGTTPTHLIYKRNDQIMIQLFLKYNADIDATDALGRTPLVYGTLGQVVTKNLIVTKQHRSRSNYVEMNKRQNPRKITEKDFLILSKRQL